MSAQDNLSPEQFFHVSSPSNRESIRQHGLLTDYSSDEDMYGEGADKHVYVSRGEQANHGWEGHDVWAVDVHGLPMEPDVEAGDYGIPQNIGPERLRLHRKGD